jgi:hypothetical protein
LFSLKALDSQTSARLTIVLHRFLRSGAKPFLTRPLLLLFNTEVTAKGLRLLHDLVPKAVRIAVLLNPAYASVAETTLREVQEAAPTIGLQIQILIDDNPAMVQEPRVQSRFLLHFAEAGQRTAIV